VLVQARISALNIFTIFFLLTLLLRANARMLQRLAQATDAFRQGYLSTRMEVTGTLESRAMAETFNDMAGKVQSLVLSLHETQRQQSEQLHFTRQLIDALPLPVFVRHADGTYLDANRAWQRLFQSQPGADGAAGASLPAKLAPQRSAHIASAHDNEIRIRPPHQPPLDMAYYEAPFTSTNGELAGTIGTLVDVTECKRAQQALRAEKERAEVTLASIGDGVITTDLGGRIETINEAAQLMTGFTADQALGRQLDDVFRLYEEPASRTASAAAERYTQPGGLQQATYEVLIHRSGERYAIEYTAAATREGSGHAAGCVLVFRDVTETRNLRHQISWHARHDALTGLYNRAALAEKLTHALFAARNRQLLLAVCMLDLDHFQAVNDTFGQRVGDSLLKEVARCLGAFITPQEAVARMGDDEFVLLLGEQPDVPAIEARLAVLMQRLAAPYAIDDRLVNSTVSISVAVFPQDDANPDTLLRYPDQAMCQAKSFGRNQLHVFDVQHDHAVQTQHTRQTRVARALHAGELVLHYQPKVNLRIGDIIGLEVLLRWQHPQEGLLGPQHVLPLVEDTVLQVELGEWVLRQALAQMRVWSEAGMGWEVSVNIAAPHFHRPNFVQRLKYILHTCPEVCPSRLELEILESAALEDMQYMRRMMQKLPGPGRAFCAGRLRHRLFVPVLPQAPARRDDQDRPVVRARPSGGWRRPHPCQSHRGAGGCFPPPCSGRRRRDRRALRQAAGAGLRARATLWHCQTHACGRCAALGPRPRCTPCCAGVARGGPSPCFDLSILRPAQDTQCAPKAVPHWQPTADAPHPCQAAPATRATRPPAAGWSAWPRATPGPGHGCPCRSG